MVSGGDSTDLIPNGEKTNLKKTWESDDRQLQEFLKVMQPRTKSKLWANDTLVASEDYPKERFNRKHTRAEKNIKEDYPKERFNRKHTRAKKHIKEDYPKERFNRKHTRAKKNIREKSTEAKVDDEEVIVSLGSNASEESDNVFHEDVISDMDYFKSKIKKEWSESESESSEGDVDQKEAKVHPSNKRSREKNEATLHDDEENDMADESERQGSAEDSDGKALDPTNPSSSSMDDKDEMLETGRLFVHNLHYGASEEELEELFSKFGKVEVHVVVDKATRQSKGIAYIQYALPESASRALKELNKSPFQGRLLHVLPGLPKPTSKKQDDFTSNQAPKTFKQRREQDRKASEASGDTKAWNTLFMRPDTVVENIARKYGIRKSDFLDREADDLAVRIALGETQVIAETKKALADAGVNVASLEELASRGGEGFERSNHVLLVKNLPYGCSEAELTKMFKKFGSLDKIILPPTRTVALDWVCDISLLVTLHMEATSLLGKGRGIGVVFLKPSEADAARNGLAYRLYKDAPLYLERAPGNVLNPTTESIGNKRTVVGEQDVKRVWILTEFRCMFSDYVCSATALTCVNVFSIRSLFYALLCMPDSPVNKLGIIPAFYRVILMFYPLILQSRFLFVKNLSFKTSDEALKSHFSERMKEGRILNVKINKHVKNGKSMGYGFIEFDSMETAANICQDLQGTNLDGHALILQFCQVKKEETALDKDEKGRSLTKLHVKNVAFEATKKDLKKLFSPFGKIKLRLPRKYGIHRGFAFVEYVTKQEAQNALQALANTHLYGRHLVLERAKRDESLEELRARTAAQFNDENGYSMAKLSKKRKHMAILDEDKMKFRRIAD
ncbi:multiple RNA-binding domain-containing protein 1-like [Eucalyptus grandis]|uniref:multiple RNA-binding domain-containing protein 1-like n=1 Tax=Eucalyptus grandis TaxID=71139 RepID=UPI00192E769D|nr:multiple RNA-binding domain-containing protein 1-like [Eucalyptus grandis]